MFTIITNYFKKRKEEKEHLDNLMARARKITENPMTANDYYEEAIRKAGNK